MIPGTKFTIGSEDYVVPPLTLKQLREGVLAKLRKHDELLAKGDSWFEAVVLRGEIIAEALKRNYPDLTDDKVSEILDLGNSARIWLAVLGASGFAPGEAPAATIAAETDTTSGQSTANSPQGTVGNSKLSIN